MGSERRFCITLVSSGNGAPGGLAPDAVAATADSTESGEAVFEYTAALAPQLDGAEPVMFYIHIATQNSVWQLPEGCD